MTISLTSPNSSTASIQKNGGDVITFDANNNATFAGNIVTTGTVVSGSAMGMRNRIINGAMQVWQRGTSFSGNVYTADRWFNNYGTGSTAIQSTDVPSSAFQYSLSFSGSVYNTMSQRIEAKNCYDLVGQTITISYWAKQTSGTGFGVALYSATAVDNFATLNTLATPTVINPTSTWAFYSVTIPAASMTASVANGIVVAFNGGIGSTTNLITGVQLEVGTSATPFERRLYGQELQLCQRYFYVIASGSGYISNASAQLTTNAYGMYTLPVTMRTAPTGSVVTGTNFYRFLANDLDDYVDSVYVNGQSPNNVIIGNGTQISNTQGRPGVFTAQNAACFVAASAEL